MGLFGWLERKVFLGDVIKEYGVLDAKNVGIGRLRTSVVLCRQKGQQKLVFRTTGTSPLSASVNYAMIDAIPSALTRLAEVFIVLKIMLVAITACGCGDRTGGRNRATARPAFTKGVLGVWVVRTERTMEGITVVPHEVSDKFTDLAAYKAWLRQQVDGLQFEFYPDNKVFLRYANPNGIQHFNWVRREDGSYWLNQPGFLGMSASIGHRFDTTSDHAAACRYQVEWNENSAPRSPLVLEKVWE